MNYSKIFKRWDITTDSFLTGRNASRIVRWLRIFTSDSTITVNEYEGQMFAILASRLRDGRLMAAVMHMSGGPGYEVDLAEFRK